MDDFIPVAVGGDIALLNGVLKVLVEKGKVDHAYVDAHTKNWEAVELRLQRLFGQRLRRGPGEPRGLQPRQRLADRPRRQAEARRHLPVGQPHLELQP